LNKEDAFQAASDVIKLSKETLYQKYALPNDVRDWRYEWAQKDIQESELNKALLKKICYRPFDIRHIYYTGRSRGFIGWPVTKVMRHIIFDENLALIAARQCKDDFGVFVSRCIAGHKSCVGYDINSVFPIYLYPETDSLDGNEKRHPNLQQEIVDEISAKIGLRFTEEKEDIPGTFAPIDILDYIYAVLYSNNYRAKYKEFLKIDFPRAPYPENKETFQELAKYGTALRNLHLLENVEPLIDTALYPIDGNNCIDKVAYKNGNVYINKTQYFENVPLEVWEYYIGGYQPAQKWLKDRKERELDYDDRLHYQKIVAALSLTIDVQAHIDAIIK
jgi:predicted helicase